MRPILPVSLLMGLGLVAAAACKPSDPGDDKAYRAAAAAFLDNNKVEQPKVSPEEAKRAEEILEKKRVEREREAQALVKAIDDATQQPESGAKKLDDACQKLADALHEFKTRTLTTRQDGRALAFWWESRKTEMNRRKGNCMALGSLEAANCISHAFTVAGPELKNRETELINKCVEKFASNSRDELVRRRAAEILAIGQQPQ